MDAAAASSAPCAAKIDRSDSEPFVVTDANRVKQARILVRPGEHPSSTVVAVVPVEGGVVEHELGTMSDPECDDSFGPSIDEESGFVVVRWTRKHLRLSAMDTKDESPCEEIGQGDCTLGCKDEGATHHHLFVDSLTGRRVLYVETEEHPDEGVAPPDVTIDDGRVIVRGAGCLESIALRGR